MAPKKLRRGIGATCSIAKRLLHPRKKVAECSAFVNVREVDGLLLTGRGEHKLSGQQKPVCFFRHPELEGVTIYCHERYTKVSKEGPSESFFPVQVSPR